MSDELSTYRSEIDRIDRALYILYKQRLDVSRKVGDYKKRHHLPVYDAHRELEMKAKLIDQYQNDEDLFAYLHLHEAMMVVSRNAQHQDAEILKVERLEQVNTVGYVKKVCDDIGMSSLNKAKKVAYDTENAVLQAIVNREIKYGIVKLFSVADGWNHELIQGIKEQDLYIVTEYISEDPLSRKTRFVMVSNVLEVVPEANRVFLMLTLEKKTPLEMVIAQMQYYNAPIVSFITLPAKESAKLECFIELEKAVCDTKFSALCHCLQEICKDVRVIGSLRTIFKDEK